MRTEIRKKEKYARKNGRRRRVHFISFYIATNLIISLLLIISALTIVSAQVGENNSRTDESPPIISGWVVYTNGSSISRAIVVFVDDEEVASCDCSFNLELEAGQKMKQLTLKFQNISYTFDNPEIVQLEYESEDGIKHFSLKNNSTNSEIKVGLKPKYYFPFEFEYAKISAKQGNITPLNIIKPFYVWGKEREFEYNTLYNEINIKIERADKRDSEIRYVFGLLFLASYILLLFIDHKKGKLSEKLDYMKVFNFLVMFLVVLFVVADMKGHIFGPFNPLVIPYGFLLGIFFILIFKGFRSKKQSDKGWLINEAGLALLSTGKPKEAEELFVRHTNMKIEDKDRKNASVGYQNLVDLQFRTGELESGHESAKKALDTAKKAGSDQYIVNSKAYLAWILHLMGKSEEANNWFRQADELQIKIDGNRLYSDRGVHYADFLISLRSIDEAYELAKQNLEICKRNNFVNSISGCHCCLGAIERIKGNHKEAEAHLQKVLEIARKVGVAELVIEALLESSRLHLDMGRHEDAIRDANEVLKICARTGFKLYEPEAEIVISKAYLALNDLEQAKDFAHSAYEKAISMSYRWREGDAAHLLGEICLAVGDKVSAREWLEKAVAGRQEILDPEVEESERMLEGL